MQRPCGARGKPYASFSVVHVEINFVAKIVFIDNIAKLFSITGYLYIFAHKNFKRQQIMCKNSLVKLSAALFMGLLLFSCSGEVVEVVDKSFSEELPGSYKMNVNSSFYTSTDAGLDASLAPLNDSLSALMDSYVAGFTENMKFLEDSVASGSGITGELLVKDTVFSATPELISVRYTVYEYTGGAHGNTTNMAFNYSPKEKRFLAKEELFTVGNAVVDSLLQGNFSNADSVYYALPTLNEASVNIAGEEAVFIYDRYVLGPYSAGEVEIRLPLESLK